MRLLRLYVSLITPAAVLARRRWNGEAIVPSERVLRYLRCLLKGMVINRRMGWILVEDLVSHASAIVRSTTADEEVRSL